MDEMSVEKWWNKICGMGKWEKPHEKPTQTPFRPPRNPHGGTETQTRDPQQWEASAYPLVPRGRLIQKLIYINNSFRTQTIKQP